MKPEDAILNTGDDIHFILYRDHSTTLDENRDLNEVLKELKEDPKLLWCVGKILNLNDDNPFYVVLSSGVFKKFKKPYNYETIEKSCIVKLEVIYTIP